MNRRELLQGVAVVGVAAAAPAVLSADALVSAASDSVPAERTGQAFALVAIPINERDAAALCANPGDFLVHRLWLDRTSFRFEVEEVEKTEPGDAWRTYIPGQKSVSIDGDIRVSMPLMVARPHNLLELVDPLLAKGWTAS